MLNAVLVSFSLQNKYRPSAAAACKGVRRSTCVCGMHVCILCDSSRLPLRCLFFFSFFLPSVSCIFQISSSICLLRGKIYDAMDNRLLATSSYKEALKLDVYCFEAFDLLTSHHMLTAQEGEADQPWGFPLIFNLIYSSQHKYAIRSLFKELSASTTKCLFYCVLPTEKDFLDSLPLSQQCTQEEEELLHFLFENKLKKVGLWF